MAFPLDPNAPGGPGRSEYLRRSHAAAGAPADDGSHEPAISLRLTENVAEPDVPAVLAGGTARPIAYVRMWRARQSAA